MSLIVGNFLFANVKVLRVHGEEGLGCHRLLFETEFALRAFEPEEEQALTQLSGRLAVQGPGGSLCYVGLLQTKNPSALVQGSRQAHQHTEILEAELERLRLERIEDLRAGKGLTFVLDIGGVVQERGRPHRVSTQVTHQVNQGTWVEILGGLGYQRMLLLELPVFDASNAPELASAVGHLERAQQALLGGEWRDAVGRCRDVYECIAQTVGDSEVRDPEVQTLFERARSMDKAARYRTIRRALKLMADAARHVDSQYDWNRTDALSMISMTSAIINQHAHARG